MVLLVGMKLKDCHHVWYCGYIDLEEVVTVEAIGLDWVIGRDEHGGICLYEGTPEDLCGYVFRGFGS